MACRERIVKGSKVKMECENLHVKSEKLCDFVIKEEPLDYIPIRKSTKRACPFSPRNIYEKSKEPGDIVIKKEPITAVHIQQEKSNKQQCEKCLKAPQMKMERSEERREGKE